MKTNDVQNVEDPNAAFLAAQAKQQTKSSLLCLFVLSVTFVLPRFVPTPFSQVVMGFGAAVGFSAYLATFPESLRSRSGSLTPAYCLLVFVWLCAATGTLFALI